MMMRKKFFACVLASCATLVGVGASPAIASSAIKGELAVSDTGKFVTENGVKIASLPVTVLCEKGQYFTASLLLTQEYPLGWMAFSTQCTGELQSVSLGMNSPDLTPGKAQATVRFQTLRDDLTIEKEIRLIEE